MQVSRLFEIVYLLLERGQMTAGELAERFEVSVRTVYRDIEALCEAGIPICTGRGKGGGIRLEESFTLGRSLLSKREQDEILAGLRALCAARTPDASPALQKLSALFGAGRGDWIDVDFSAWGSGRGEAENFRLLRGAILEKRVVTFRYFGSDGRARPSRSSCFSAIRGGISAPFAV